MINIIILKKIKEVITKIELAYTKIEHKYQKNDKKTQKRLDKIQKQIDREQSHRIRYKLQTHLNKMRNMLDLHDENKVVTEDEEGRKYVQ